MTTSEIKHKSQLHLDSQSNGNSAHKLFVPKADIYESENNIIIHTDIPGADENTVDITLEKNILTLTAAVPKTKNEGYTDLYVEYDAGDYKRAFALPNEIDRNGIEATVKNGVLKLTLPKSKDSLPKKIAVTGN